MTLVQKLNKMPHKILFYLGFTVVLLFLGLSYWQFSSYKEDSTIINDITSSTYNGENEVSL